MLPWGALGTIWLLSSAAVNRRRTLRHWLRLFFGMAALSLVCTFEFTLMSLDWNRYWRGGIDATAQFGELVFVAIGLIPLFLLDFIQTVAFSVTLGIGSTRGTHMALDVRVWTTFIFLAVQVGVYTLVGILGAAVLPMLLGRAGIDGIGARVLVLAIEARLVIA